MGDCLKLYKDKRHRSSSSIAGAALEGRFSERKLDIKAKIIEGGSILKSPLTTDILEEPWIKFRKSKMSCPGKNVHVPAEQNFQEEPRPGPSVEVQNSIEEAPGCLPVIVHSPSDEEEAATPTRPRSHLWGRRSLGKVQRMRLSPRKHYEGSTIASRMKLRPALHGLSPSELQIPFLSPKSTEPSFNIYANLQQVIGRAKSLSPFTKFHTGMLNRLRSPLRRNSPNKATSGGGDEEGGALAGPLLSNAERTRVLRTPQRSGDPEEFAVDCIKFPNASTSKAKKGKNKFLKNRKSGTPGSGGEGSARKESKAKFRKPRNIIKRLF